jgi:hypothetical protein
MTVVQAFPAHGDVFFDVRDDGRNLRVNWHHERDLVVLSTWRHGSCIATCQVERADVPKLVAQLVDGLVFEPSPPWTEPIYADFSPVRMRPDIASRVSALLRRRRKDRD